jgi:RHS repeat-associated protein
MTDATGSTGYTYDDLNNAYQITTTFTGMASGSNTKTITYAHWPNGNRRWVNTPAGYFGYYYDQVGRLNGVDNPTYDVADFYFDQNGRLSGQYTGNYWIYTEYAYNARGMLTYADNYNGSDWSFYSNFYGAGGPMRYDAAGSRKGMTVYDGDYTGTVSYLYNSRNQLAHETSTRVGGTLDQGFGYDSAGNPTTLRGTPNLPYNRDNQRTGTGTYVYDGNGNPTTYKGTTLTFDVENRMTAYGNALTAGYNGNGLRAWKTASGTTTYYLYDGTNLLCELNASGAVTATNTWGANGLVSRRVGTTSTFYVYDPQGSVAQRLDASENVVSSDLYDAYGNRISGTTADPVGYDGKWGYYTDSETGLALCTYRYYDPSNGRWLTRDPIGYRGGVDLYGYVGDDPVTLCDPDGFAKLKAAPWPQRSNSDCDIYRRLAGKTSDSAARHYYLLAYEVCKSVGNSLWDNCVRGCLQWVAVGHSWLQTEGAGHVYCFGVCSRCHPSPLKQLEDAATAWTEAWMRQQVELGPI